MLVRIARVEWMRFEEGGRKRPPEGLEYRAISRFQNAEGTLAQNGRDLGLIRLNRCGDDYTWIAHVFFSPGDPPNHLLADGVHFELFDGPKRVARGQILGGLTVSEHG